MKYCPYCGAGLLSSTFSFCPECGTKLPTQEEIMAASIDEVINHPESITVAQTSNPRKKSSREKRSAKASKKHRQARSVSTPEPSPSDEYYDGYYDDVMPPDLDREKDSLDKALVKRIIVLAMCVTIIILCASHFSTYFDRCSFMIRKV